MPKNPSNNVGKYAGMALMLPLATLIGFGLGYGLDSFFHTVWLRYVFLAFGAAAGILDLYRELIKDV